jgi:hypothetical protein
LIQRRRRTLASWTLVYRSLPKYNGAVAHHCLSLRDQRGLTKTGAQP